MCVDHAASEGARVSMKLVCRKVAFLNDFWKLQ